MTADDERIIPVIMCGGSGTRLWPLSRESLPKQFIELVGDRSTFQETVVRVREPSLFATPLVIANDQQRFTVAEQLQRIGCQAQIALEPMARDSAPAVAVATLLALERDASAVVLILAADHVIRGVDAFVDSIRRAVPHARSGFIMTLGIPPTRPATEYGYIKPGKGLGADAFAVDAFVEKPDAATAARCLAEGYLWNSGNFLYRADIMAQELEKFAPETIAAARAAIAGMKTDLGFLRLDPSAFERAPKKSIDQAVMERTARAGVVPASFDWCDVGTWTSVWETSERTDPDGNVTRGAIELVETTNSLVFGDGVLAAAVGLDDAIVVATPDAVLVASKEHAHRVKSLVDEMRRRNRSQASEHLRVHRPWGWFQRVDHGPRFQVKRIVIKPGSSLSLQKHFHRAEHWVVVHGTAEVTVGAQTRLVQENESVYVPMGVVHRLRNPGRIDLEIIEVQVGSYTGEDDIVRLEDPYKR